MTLFVDNEERSGSRRVLEKSVLRAKRTDSRFPRGLYDVRQSVATVRPPDRFHVRPPPRRTASDALARHPRQQGLAFGS